MDVAVFTDTYLPTVNGVSYTISEWKKRWEEQYGKMPVVYPSADTDVKYGIPAKSVTFPFYKNFRIGTPKIGLNTASYDIVHAHTPFTVGASGLISARRSSTPFVLSYHTPIHEYADYMPVLQDFCKKTAKKYQNLIFRLSDRIVVPTDYVATKVEERTDTPVEVISNGVDLEFFSPTTENLQYVDRKLDLSKPVVGYTGRLGFEKNVDMLLDKLGHKDINILIGGDGPARESLEHQSEKCSANVVFTGFVDRENLPILYSTMDVFGFPSTVETQGKAALESISCGTPVVGINEGALVETITDGLTGRLCSEDAFEDTIMQVLENIEPYEQDCLKHRKSVSVEKSVQELEELYLDVCR